MNSFFTTLPAILGISAFVIYLIIRKSIFQDPIVKTILDKVRNKSPQIYKKLESLDNKQKEALLKKDMIFRNALSEKELNILDNALKHQFRTNIYVYTLSGFLLLGGIGLFIYSRTISQPLVADNIQIQDTDSTARKILVDLDPVTVTWTSAGRDEMVSLALENVETGKQSKKISVQASEGKVVFKADQYDNYDKILSNRQPLQSNRIRAIIFGQKEAFKSREFEIKVGVKLLCIAELPDKINFLAIIDNVIIDSYLYFPRLALFRQGNFDDPVYLSANELASRHTFIVNKPENLSLKNYILTYTNPQDDRIVRTIVDLSEFYKIQKNINPNTPPN